MTAFNPSIRVGKQLEKTYRLHHDRSSKAEMHTLFDKTLRRLGLEDTDRILKSYPFALSGGMLQRFPEIMSIKMLSLSNREAEIAGHLALGKTEKEVAGELCVSVDTVHTHKKSIYRKLGARSIADVTRIVAEYITRKNLTDLIRKELIEPNVWKVCIMMFFLSLQMIATMNNMDLRPARVRTNTVRIVRIRKNE